MHTDGIWNRGSIGLQLFPPSCMHTLSAVIERINTQFVSVTLIHIPYIRHVQLSSYEDENNIRGVLQFAI